MKLNALFTILTLLAIAQPAFAVDCPGANATMKSLGFRQVTVSSTSIGVGTSPVAGTVRMAVVLVESNSIRYRDDGTAPTAAVGMLVPADAGMLLCGSAASTFRAIRVTSDALLSISFYGD